MESSNFSPSDSVITNTQLKSLYEALIVSHLEQ